MESGDFEENGECGKKWLKPGCGEHENTPNSSEISPRLILSSSTSSNENVLLDRDKCFQERTQKPLGASKSTTQNEARQKDFI